MGNPVNGYLICFSYVLRKTSSLHKKSAPICLKSEIMGKLRKHRLIVLFLLPGLLGLALSQLIAHREASATIVLYLTLEDLAQQADLIVQGRSKKITSAWDAERKRIFTYITIVSERCFKVTKCPPQIKIRQMGGVVDDVVMTIAGTPSFHQNERVLLFLKETSTSGYQILGMSQGKFSIIRSGEKGGAYVKRDLSRLKLLKKKGSVFYSEDQNQPERRVDLESFIKEIESYSRSR